MRHSGLEVHDAPVGCIDLAGGILHRPDKAREGAEVAHIQHHDLFLHRRRVRRIGPGRQKGAEPGHRPQLPARDFRFRQSEIEIDLRRVRREFPRLLEIPDREQIVRELRSDDSLFERALRGRSQRGRRAGDAFRRSGQADRRAHRERERERYQSANQQ